jgi:hypothetical protein
MSGFLWHAAATVPGKEKRKKKKKIYKKGKLIGSTWNDE